MADWEQRGSEVWIGRVFIAEAINSDQAENIVACLRALDGLEPEKLGALIEAATQLVSRYTLGKGYDFDVARLDIALADLGVFRG